MDIRIEIVKLIVVLFALGPVVAQNGALVRVKPDKYKLSKALKWIPWNSTETIADAVVGFAQGKFFLLTISR